ncbi:MAG: SLATT domain-containing protein [Candidatus Methanoperedens sp.]|nr:SLATT domain-containing protein [Candidatus Methanoperedens sp.]
MARQVFGDVDKPSLEAVLPLPEADYLQDFETQESRDEFRELLALAKSTHVLDKAESRKASYEQCGHYVAHNCDVLVAIWDGKPASGQGGTAEIVEYARKIGRSIFWINSENGKITEERHEDHTPESLEYLDIYNAEYSNNLEAESAVKSQYIILTEQAKDSGLSQDILEPLLANLLPQFVRADILAQRYQSQHMKAGSAVYALAAAAVATVTIQTLLFPHISELLWLEVVEIAFILMLLLASYIGDWQRKWIDYRFLAERLRAALFLCMASIKCEQSPPPPYLSEDWVLRAYAWIWDKRPQAPPLRNIHALKKFLLTAWVGDQISFYDKKSKRHRRRHVLLARGGEALFLVTLVVAFVHAVEFQDSQLSALSALPSILASVTIILPAVGAALAGIRIHREYLRNAERYAPMVRHLSIIRDQIKQISDTDMENLTMLLEKANDMMLRENQDWRVVFTIPKLEAP